MKDLSVVVDILRVNQHNASNMIELLNDPLQKSYQHQTPFGVIIQTLYNVNQLK